MYKEKRARKLSLFVSFFLPIIIAALLTACGAGGGGGNTESNTTNQESTGIGSNGGTVISSDGRAKVVIPAGALTEAANITVATVSNQPSGNIGIAYEIGPDGTTFSQPVTISVTYDEASLPSGFSESDLKLGTVTNNQWEALSNSTVDTAANVISGATTHLSIYGILEVSSSVAGPSSPTGVIATAADGQTIITWDPVSGATSYNLYMASQSGLTKGNYSILANGMMHSNATSPYIHTGLANGTTYYFVVTAENTIGESVESNEVSAIPLSGQTALHPGSMATARNGHTATLLPDGKVLIAGGDNGDYTSLSSVELYDPSTGVFTNISNMTTVRDEHTATLLSTGKVLIAGGNDDASMEIYDPATGTFTNIGKMPTVRYEHTATLLPNGKVLIAGGYDDNFIVSTSAELYDPATDTFTPTSRMAPARHGHTATLLANGKVLISGGADTNDNVLSSAEIYDPAAGTFTAVGNMTTAREGHTAVLLSTGKVLIAGGWDGSNNNVLSSTELYDLVTGTFTATGSMTTARYDHTATLLSDGKEVLILGGYNNESYAFSSAEQYTPATGVFSAINSMVSVSISPESASVATGGTKTFTATVTDSTNTKVTWSVQEGPSGGTITSEGVYTAPSTSGTYHIVATSQADPYKNVMATVLVGGLLTARYNHTATLLPNGMVLIAGGQDSNDIRSILSSVELYDPTTGTFTPTGSMTTALRISTATQLSNGNVLMIGGEWDNSGFLHSSATLYEFYYPATGNFAAIGSLLIAREFHTATLLSNGKVLIAGGYNGSGTLSSVELYDPTTRTFTATASMLTARYNHTATLLSNGKVLVIGGHNNSTLSSAELYDPASGTFTGTGSMLTFRTGHTATLLSNGKVLIAGGYDDDGGVNFSSAELYDPATGIFTATGSMTTDRQRHTATLLPNGKVLITGGLGVRVSYSVHLLSSAELYDPATGIFTAIGSLLIAREQHTATSLLNGKVLIVGGYNGSDALSSAELYDPTAGTFNGQR